MPRKIPNFNGVKGEIIQDIDTDNLVFEERKKGKQSPYDDLLIAISNKPGAVIKFDDKRARVAIKHRANKLNMRIAFAENGNDLYVKYIGSTILNITIAMEDKLLEILKDFEPISEMKLVKHFNTTNFRNEVNKDTIEQLLESMKDKHEIKQDELGMWSRT